MKAAIYLRTSTAEQFPEKQEAECRQFAESRGYDIEGVYSEQISGFKQDISRPQYELIKEKAFKGEIKAVIVWAFDRWVRNRDTLLDDVTILRGYGCKLHSVKDAWLEAINVEGPLGKTIQEFLLGLIGSLAELESQRKSERVRMAFKNHQGKKWGRKKMPSRVVDDVLALHQQGNSVRNISKSVTYYDKNKNLRNLSVGSVSNIINKGVMKE